MITQSNETKIKASLIDLLGGNTKPSTAKSNDIFSKLLASFETQTRGNETKIVQSNDFKAIIDPKASQTKSTDTKNSALKELQALLVGKDEKDSALVSKELISNLSTDQVRTLINTAKEYLKNAITAKSPEHQADPKTLPKTLGGLVQLAQKMGLEPESIALTSIVTKPEEQKNFSPELLSKPLFDTKALVKLSTSAPETAALEATTLEAITQLLNAAKTKEQKSAAAATESTKSSTDNSTKESVEKMESQPLKALLQHLNKQIPETTAAPTAELKNIDTKTASASPATPKADNLITLLKGDDEAKESKPEKVNGSKIENDSSKSAHVAKADSLEVKAKEATQSMRYFATDLKDAVESYKPPLTRLTMKLNPEKLGEVEVTLVQRGNNIHVSIQSNNTSSVAFLAHNATELKAQLAHQGITGTTMNFMSSGEGQTGQQTPQQQQQEQQQNRVKAYESLKDLELNDEQLSALEIIIPHYA